MSRINIYGNPTQTDHLDELRRFLHALTGQAPACRLAVEQDYLEFLRTEFPDEAAQMTSIGDSTDEPPTLALSIGGDGTFLHTANLVASAGTPIMGINAGHLGYLSAADIATADTAAQQIAEGDYTIESRTVIEVSSSSPLLPQRPFALNEVAILKQDTASMITIDTYLNGHLLASITGDGLIISTPTGSTGYNLSVGGPIISPRASNLVLSPVAAHTLSMRPLVITDDVRIDIRAKSRTHTMLMAIDGRSTPLPVDTHLSIAKAGFSVNVAHLSGHNFIDTLRHKLHWGIDGC